MLQLVFPNISHKEKYLLMIQEWQEKDVILTSPGKLFAGNNFQEFLEIVNRDLTNSSNGVNSTLFFLVKDNTDILGAIHIRHHIDHPNLIEMGGHIGYGIRPTERGKGYAKEMLKLALIEAGKLGIAKVLITCSDDNIASSKVIEANGGIFERYAFKDGKKGKRYWVDILDSIQEHLLSLERELLQYETRHNPKRIDELLADDFFECGKTGIMFGKKECLEWSPQEKTKKLEARNITVHIISDNIGQVRYIAQIQGDGEVITTSFRTSLWRKSESGWQMFFHQGTLIPD